MSRYIEADAYRKKWADIFDSAYGDSCCELFKKSIDEQPTADVVEVVRCKDCVHCADDWNGNQPMFTCELGMCHESVEPSGYCFCGERREEIDGCN